MGYTLISTKRRGKLLEEQIKKQSKIQTKATATATATTVSTEITNETSGAKMPTVNVEYVSYNKKQASLNIELSGITYPTSTGNNCSIHSAQIAKICNTIIKSKLEMKQEIEAVFMDVVKKIQNMFENDIQQIVDTVTMIDILQNKV